MNTGQSTFGFGVVCLNALLFSVQVSQDDGKKKKKKKEKKKDTLWGLFWINLGASTVDDIRLFGLQVSIMQYSFFKLYFYGLNVLLEVVGWGPEDQALSLAWYALSAFIALHHLPVFSI